VEESDDGIHLQLCLKLGTRQKLEEDETTLLGFMEKNNSKDVGSRGY
jgi:hypothetical protein